LQGGGRGSDKQKIILPSLHPIRSHFFFKKKKFKKKEEEEEEKRKERRRIIHD
jgi:hypothetical protein